jgi:hypothetical protein
MDRLCLDQASGFFPGLGPGLAGIVGLTFRQNIYIYIFHQKKKKKKKKKNIYI